MDIDNRGVRRGHCKVEDCDCDIFECQTSSNACSYCDHAPARHEKLQTTHEVVDGSSGIDTGKENDRNLGENMEATSQEVDTINRDYESNTGQNGSTPVTCTESQSLYEETPSVLSYGNSPSDNQKTEESHIISDRAAAAGHMVATAIPNSHMMNTTSSDMSVSNSADTGVLSEHSVTMATSVSHYKNESSTGTSEVTRVDTSCRREMVTMTTANSRTESTDVSRTENVPALCHTEGDLVDNQEEKPLDASRYDEVRSSHIHTDTTSDVTDDSSDSSESSDGSDESISTNRTTRSTYGNRDLPLALPTTTNVPSMMLQNVGKFNYEMGNIHIHNNRTEVEGSNIESQSRQILKIRGQERKYFVETKACEEVEEILRCGHVTIQGNAGEGKTAIAMHFLQLYQKGKGHVRKRYKPLIVYFPEEFRQLWDPDEYQIFLVDDIFGIANLDGQKLMWIGILKELHKQFELQSENSNNETANKTLVIFTSRTHIIKEADAFINDLRFFRAMFVVNLSNPNFCLTPDEKMKIFDLFAKRRNRKLDHETLQYITHETNSSHGFPHCVDLFTEHERLFSQGQQFFYNPLFFLRKELEILCEKNKTKFCALVIAMMNNGRFSKSEVGGTHLDIVRMLEIGTDNVKSTIVHTANQLLGSYFSLKDDEFVFLHPSLLDAVMYVFVNHVSDIQVIIQSCKFSFISERLRSKSYKPHSNEQVIIVDESQYTHLVQRFVSEVSEDEGNWFMVLTSQFLDDAVFDKLFLDAILVKENISYFFDPSKMYGESVFHLAAYQGKYQFIEAVFERALPKSSSIENFTEVVSDAFITSCSHGNFDLVQLLLISTEYLDAVLDESKTYFDLSTSPPLSQAIQGSNFDIFKYLVEKGSDYHKKDLFMNSYLHHSVLGEQNDILELLLKKGLNPNTINCDHQTPVFGATSTSAVDILVQYGADINHLNTFKRTALFYCDNVETAKAMVQFGCDVNVLDVEGKLAAFSLATDGVMDIHLLETMVKAGMNLNHVDYFGRSIHFYLASSSGRNDLIFPCLKYVLNVVSPNIFDINGCSPLHHVVGHSLDCHFTGFIGKKEELALQRTQLLLNHSDIDINKCNDNSRSALFETTHVGVAEELVIAGANVHLEIPGFDNALEAIAQNGVFSKRLIFSLMDQCTDVWPFLKSILRNCSHKILKSASLKQDVVKILKESNKIPPGDIVCLIEYATKNCKTDLLEFLLNQFGCAHYNITKLLSGTRESKVAEKLLLYLAKDKNHILTNTETIQKSLFLLAEGNALSSSFVKSLLTKGVNFCSRDQEGQTVLFKLNPCNEMVTEMFDVIVNSGVNVNVQNKHGLTVLHKLVKNCCTDLDIFKQQCIECLLENGADISIADHDGKLPIHSANHPKLLVLLLEHAKKLPKDLSKQLFQQRDKNEELPIITIARQGAMSRDVYLALKQLDVDFTVRHKDGRTCLHFCIAYDLEDSRIMPVLFNLVKDTSVNAVSNSGQSVLDVLVDSSLKKEAIFNRLEFLFGNGFNLGISVYLFSYIRNSDVAIKLLTGYNASFFQHSTSHPYLTALKCLARNSVLNVEVLELFLKLGFQVDEDKSSDIVYYILISSQSEDEINLILKKLLTLGCGFGLRVQDLDHVLYEVSAEKLNLRITYLTSIAQEVNRFDLMPTLKLIRNNIKESMECNQEEDSCIHRIKRQASMVIADRQETSSAFALCGSNTEASSIHVVRKPEVSSTFVSYGSNTEDRTVETCLSMLYNNQNKNYTLLNEIDAILSVVDGKKRQSILNNILLKLCDPKMHYIFALHYIISKGADVNMSFADGKNLLHLSPSFLVTRYLIKNGVDVNAEDMHGNTPLFYTKDIYSIMALVSQGANVNHKNKEQKTALHSIDGIDSVKFLISVGADINAKDISDRTALECTNDESVRNYLMNLKCDVSNMSLYHIIMTLTKQDKLTVIHLTYYAEKLDNVIFEKFCKENSSIILHSLVQSGRSNKVILPLLQFFLDHGSDSNATDHDGNTPIGVMLSPHTLSSYSEISGGPGIRILRRIQLLSISVCNERLWLLLQKGADPLIKNRRGLSPFDYVKDERFAKVLVLHLKTNDAFQDKRVVENILLTLAQHGTYVPELVSAVAELNGNIHVQDDNGRTVLHHLVYRYNYGKYLDKDIDSYMKSLKTHCFDFDIVDKAGNTALYLANLVRAKNSLVEMLLTYGSNASAKDALERALLEQVCSSSFAVTLFKNDADIPMGENSMFKLVKVRGLMTVEVIHVLLERNVDLNETDDDGNNLLHYSEHLQVDSLKALLQKGVPVNVRNASGQTPLHVLCSLFKVSDQLYSPIDSDKQMSIQQKIKMFFEAGADPNISDFSGTLPLQLIKDCVIAEMFVENEGEINCFNCTCVQSEVLNKLPCPVLDPLFEGRLRKNDVNPRLFDCRHDTTNKTMETFVFLLTNDLLTIGTLKCLANKGLELKAMDLGNRSLLHAFMFKSLSKLPDQISIFRYESERVLSQKTDMIAFLIHKGLSVNAKDDYGKTPLHFLMKQPASKAILQVLLENGADWSTIDKDGNLPVPVSSWNEDDIGYVLCMFAAYFENAKERYIDNTPLVCQFAKQTRFFSLPLLKASIVHKVDFSMNEDIRKSVLESLYRDGTWEVLNLLKDKISFSDTNSKGETFLHNLALTWRCSITNIRKFEIYVAFLLENGVDINAVSFDRLTALDYFCLCEDYRYLSGVISVFIKYGATIDNWVVNESLFHSEKRQGKCFRVSVLDID